MPFLKRGVRMSTSCSSALASEIAEEMAAKEDAEGVMRSIELENDQPVGSPQYT